ncbi:MAG: PmoA family protein [Kiritimatiellaeota bacterium]|nr:PmoA family protein [Kiritimatiellota bacterium]
MRGKCIVGVASLAAVVACAEWDKSVENQLAWQQEGKDVWRFHFDPKTESKPYFDLSATGGPSLTWARPADHVWHYGLWFSWKYINGVNYWEEKNGKSDGTTLWDTPQIETASHGKAFIEMNLQYRPQGAAEDATVLKEKRTVAIIAPSLKDGSYFMEWTQEFTACTEVKLDRTPIPGEPDGKDWGGYAGLSLRFAKGMQEVETVAAEVGRVERNADKRLDVTAAGVEQSGVFEGEPYGIAILAHPENPRKPGDWYPLEGGDFNFLNAAFLLKGAHTLAKDETMTLRYRVHVHPGRWDAQRLKSCWTGCHLPRD